MSPRRKLPEPSTPATPAGRAPAAPAPPSTLGASSRFSGEISGRGDLRIDGSLEGTIRIRGRVEIRRAGNAHAELQASELEVQGRIDGKMQVEGLLRAVSGCEMIGQISAARWIVEEGARLQAEIRSVPGPTRN